MSLRLDWCSYEAAKYACQKWHYSKSIPTPPYNLVGVWENEKYIGCVIFSRGANKDLGKPYGLSNTEICELTRVALNTHDAPVTRIISIALRMLTKRNPGIKAVISFADQNQNHEGVIYKAGNWIYIGETSESFLYYDKNGKKYHPRQVSPTGIKIQYGNYRRVPKPDDLEIIKQKPKHRFIYPIDKKWYDEYMRQQSKSKTLGIQSRKGGAVPTLTHQKHF